MSDYLLYVGKEPIKKELPSNITIKMEKLKPFSNCGKGRFANFYWWLINKEVYLCEAFDNETNELMHYTYVMKKSYKFPFMEKNDYMIGPSVTIDNFKGRGVFGFALAYAQNKILSSNKDANFIALIRDDNFSCHKGIEKIGMKNSNRRFNKNKLKIYKEVIESEKK